MEGRSPAGTDESAVGRMRERWREFAREDALHYIAANRTEWAAADFYEMGRDLAADLLSWAGEASGRERMLEIGCGAGRMLVHFASCFQRVIGIDIAPEMIELAKPQMPENVELAVASGSTLEGIGDASIDLVLSLQVFQHIPERGVVGSYISETARVLKPLGRAVLQFDTRPNPIGRRLAMRLPDFVLPRDQRRYIRRYPLPAEWPRTTGSAAGLRVVDERSPGSTDHFLLFERPA